MTPNGETESSLMSSLTSGTDNFYVAWGSASNVDLSQTLSVGMLRNYAKVTVEAAEGSGFVVEGFALPNMLTKDGYRARRDIECGKWLCFGGPQRN